MKSHDRALEFESLERLTLLSTIHPAIGHESHAPHNGATPLPAFVRAVERVAERFGSHVSAQPIIVVPGGFTEYQITFQVKGQTYTTDITIPDRPTTGPTPG
ncbi:MAG: hypothetical protein P4L84_12440 [Isosphaeraceae bacterium]|nr:hypothetical protein [Isosphaeraceae bacterium]